jgi:HSP20 family protein
VTEGDSEIVVTVELPGIDEKDIDITLTRDKLTIKGEKSQDTEEDAGNYYRRERQHGSFCRSIQIPIDIVNEDKVEAVFKNGLLSITLPKVKEAQEILKRIKVTAE